MSREIKFRAWHKTYKRMMYFELGELNDSMITKVEDGWYLEDVELMESIGRPDLDDREMYEGDIIEYLDNTSQGLIKKIVVINDIRHLPDFGCSKWEKIIGNIYESPEQEEGEINVKPSKPTLADLYPYYSARQLNGRWYPVASVDGTNWVSPFEETFAPIHASQAVEKEDVLQWVRNNGGRVFG